MFKYFELAAIIAENTKKNQMDLLRIPLTRELKDELIQDWSSQYNIFVTDIREIDFDPGYKPDDNERFRVAEFMLPTWLTEEDISAISDLDTLSNNTERMNLIRGIVAYTRNGDGEELMLFQRFMSAQIIQPGKFLLQGWNSYEGIKRPGLVLARKLSAIYQPNEQKLLFDSFRNVNTFLPLNDFYKEASEQDIREILNHNRLEPENSDEIARNADQWTRKRFSMLRDSGVLDEFSTDEILTRSKEYDISIQIEEDRIVFPADKRSAKRLLQFLNEERFRGPITDTLYETNSKKKAE